jgi:ParB/RepB/Spo0J family partition protein
MAELIKPSKLVHIKTDSLITNPNNPRIIFDEEPLKILQNSIKEAGILNPLLVYERKKDNQLIILDGERRWICAKKLGLNTVPANIIEEPDALTNIIRMFNIHNVREPWQLMPTALKLEFIIRHTKTRSESKLSEITGLSPSTVRRCKILLSYPKIYQDIMISKNPEDRIKTDFFIELYQVLNLLEKNFHSIKRDFSREKLIKIFLNKYQRKIITNVVSLRRVAELIRSIKRGISKQEIEKDIYNFLTKEDSTLDDLVKSSEAMSLKSNFNKAFTKLAVKLTKTNFSNFKKDKELLKSLMNLRKIIEEKIEEIKKGEA